MRPAPRRPSRRIHLWHGAFTFRGHGQTFRSDCAFAAPGGGLEIAVPMIELTAVKGGTIWVNPAQVQYVALPDSAASSMYGDNNNRAGARLHFAQGAHLDVREAPGDVAALLNA